MYKKTAYFLIVIILLGGSIFIWTATPSNKLSNTGITSLHYLIFTAQEGGFGYQILAENKTLIKQNIIPAIAFKTSFKSHKDAEKVAKLVIEKISNKESPVIKISDLETLKVVF